MEPRSIAFHHFGCKVNFAEASSLSRQFKDNGFLLKDFREMADVYVISTCVVTAVAEKKCRAAIRQAHHLNPEAKIAVIGCFPELMPRELENMEGVSLVLGHSAKFTLLEEVERLFHRPGNGKPAAASPADFIPSWSFGDRTRSFVKTRMDVIIIVHIARSPSPAGVRRSDTIDNVLHNVQEAVSSGASSDGSKYRDFGRNNEETFLDLLRKLEVASEAPRIRVSSLEPDLLNNEIIELIASSGKFMPHFHIPLQSGADRILKLMKRKYQSEHFASRILKIRSLDPCLHRLRCDRRVSRRIGG